MTGICQNWNLSELIFNFFTQNWNLSELELAELEFVRIGICQNQNLSQSEFVRIGICQNRNLSVSESVRIRICQNLNLSELNLSELAIISFGAKNALQS